MGLFDFALHPGQRFTTSEIKELDKICNCEKCNEHYKQLIDIDKIQINELVIEKIFKEYLNKLRNI